MLDEQCHVRVTLHSQPLQALVQMLLEITGANSLQLYPLYQFGFGSLMGP